MTSSRKSQSPKAQDPQATPDDFPDIPGLPGEIAAILGRGNFPSLSDDEYAKVGAFLSASSRQRTRFSELLTPEGKKEYERMTEAMNRLRTIQEYNTTLRRSVATPSAQADAPSSATPQWPLRPFDPTCKELATAADCAYLRNVYWSIRPEWDGVNVTAVKSTLLNYYKSWTPDHLVGLTVWDIGQLLAGAPKNIAVELRGEPPTAAFQTQVLKLDDEGAGNLGVPWNPHGRNCVPGAEAVDPAAASSENHRTPAEGTGGTTNRGETGRGSQKIWSHQHCPSCGLQQVEFISMKAFSGRPGTPSYNTVRDRVNAGAYWSDVGKSVPWCPVCKERTPEGPGMPPPTGGSAVAPPGTPPFAPSKQDQQQMLAWAQEVVRETPDCKLPPEDRPPLEGDPPAIHLGFERLNDAVAAINELARTLGGMPTRDEAETAAKKAISKARSQDVRFSHQTDAYDKRRRSEDGQRFDDDDQAT